ncbi:MAG TPA: hypothetical protein ENK16_06710 [Chromatiales bacterium]|nr:hypothetical protein [Chromatiales bacterium]
MRTLPVRRSAVDPPGTGEIAGAGLRWLVMMSLLCVLWRLMMRVILVPVADRPECVHALKVAFGLATRFDADLIGTHIRPHQRSEVRMPPALGGESADWMQITKGWNAAQLSRNAKTLFANIMAGRAGYPVAKRPAAHPVAIWSEQVGSPGHIIPIIGPLSDLLVLSRPARKGGRLASLFLTEALLNSCRPVLVVPQKVSAVPGNRILIAWNQSPEASRAVAAAMPVLEAAGQVVIAAPRHEAAAGPKSGQLRRYLRHHRVSAELLRIPGRKPETELIDAYGDSGSDLLLMGAYSRSRFRQQVFGGVTDYMLHHARIPVLMLHS